MLKELNCGVETAIRTLIILMVICVSILSGVLIGSESKSCNKQIRTADYTHDRLPLRY